MIKIEMTTEITERYPTGHAGEYLWMIGQPWPVPFQDESRVQRVEAWGPEIDFVKHLNGSAHAQGLVLEWKGPAAVQVSQQLRKITAES